MKTTTLERDKAMIKDTAGSFYAEHDEDHQCYGVFGSETGFCYLRTCSEAQARQEARQMTRDFCSRVA
jgi:hypothetical protein